MWNVNVAALNAYVEIWELMLILFLSSWLQNIHKKGISMLFADSETDFCDKNQKQMWHAMRDEGTRN